MWQSVQEVSKIRGDKNLRIGLGKNTMLEAIEEVQAVKDAVKEPMENPHCFLTGHCMCRA